MTAIATLDLTSWGQAPTPDAQQTAVLALEGGGVLVLPHLAFNLQPDESRFLSPQWSDGRAKNISFDGKALKGARSDYDHLMLGLHDCAKADMSYQQSCRQQVVRFAPGTTWLCFSDQVMHAAVSGQHMLEQTIHLPVSALYDSASSPLAILERLCGRALVPAA